MSEFDGFKSSESLTKWVRCFLCIFILVAVTSMISGYFEYQLLTDFQNGVYTSQKLAISDADASDQRQSLIGVVWIAVYIITGFLTLRWIHRANYNARQLGAKNMKFTPGWSIGYYFIPILTLWKPYQAMKEIWKASKNPSNWESEDAGSLLPIWWTLWIVSNALGQAVFRFSSKAEEIPAMLNLNLITQASDALDISLALALLAIVKGVHQMQNGHMNYANGMINPTENACVGSSATRGHEGLDVAASTLGLNNKSWYVAEGEKKKGPLDNEEIVQLIKSRRVTKSNLVWTEGMPAWAPAGETDLNKFIPAEPPPLSQTSPPPLPNNIETTRVLPLEANAPITPANVSIQTPMCQRSTADDKKSFDGVTVFWLGLLAVPIIMFGIVALVATFKQ